jgi:hypothetical protein
MKNFFSLIAALLAWGGAAFIIFAPGPWILIGNIILCGPIIISVIGFFTSSYEKRNYSGNAPDRATIVFIVLYTSLMTIAGCAYYEKAWSLILYAIIGGICLLIISGSALGDFLEGITGF